MQAQLLINWYKPSGKWVAHCRIDVPDEFQPSYNPDSLRLFIEENQHVLTKNWVDGDYFVSVSCIKQDDADSRFFERLFRY